MDRRAFITASAAGALGMLAGTRRLGAQGPTPIPAAPASGIPYGETRLPVEIPDDDDNERYGSMYVPKSYRDGVPMPVVCYLHGLGGSALSARNMFPLAEEFGVIILAPESRKVAWGRDAPGFDRDSVYIVESLKYLNRTVYMDNSHVAMSGVSDGATYALAMGLVYGESFTHVMVFSEGVPTVQRKSGKPKIFIGHGTQDTQMPIDETARVFVPAYKADGYDVTYDEYIGGHGAPAAVVRAGFEWFVGKPKK